MDERDTANITVQIRVRRHWLLRLNAWLWSTFDWLFPFVDPDVIASEIANVARVEYRIGHGKWRPLLKSELN